MIKIIGEHGSGKTKKLVEQAYNEKMIIVCKDPEKMSIKGDAYGYPGVTYLSYNFFMSNDCNFSLQHMKFLIDDVDEFLKSISCDIVGYSIAND